MISCFSFFVWSLADFGPRTFWKHVIYKLRGANRFYLVVNELLRVGWLLACHQAPLFSDAHYKPASGTLPLR